MEAATINSETAAMAKAKAFFGSCLRSGAQNFSNQIQLAEPLTAKHLLRTAENVKQQAISLQPEHGKTRPPVKRSCPTVRITAMQYEHTQTLPHPENRSKDRVLSIHVQQTATSPAVASPNRNHVLSEAQLSHNLRSTQELHTTRTTSAFWCYVCTDRKEQR